MLPTAGSSPTLGSTSDQIERLPDSTSGGSPKDFFLYTFSAKDLGVDEEGYLVAFPCVLFERPGLNGVTERRGKVSSEGAILKHVKASRVVLPDDFPCTVQGKPRPTMDRDARGVTRPVCTYRVTHYPTVGKPQYHDAWNRYVTDEYGDWYLDVDAEGYKQFLRDVAAWLNPQPHYLRRVSERLHLEGRSIKIADIKIAGQEPAKPARKPKEG